MHVDVFFYKNLFEFYLYLGKRIRIIMFHIYLIKLKTKKKERKSRAFL